MTEPASPHPIAPSWTAGDSLPGAGFDQSAPNAARIYDWLIGGKDSYAADRDAGRKLATAVPGARQAARDNRAFLARVTRYLAADAGITQFIDIGAGLPGPLAVHEVARHARPGARVVYVDHDPVVIAHARALLSGFPLDGPPQVTAVEADLRYPRNLLTDRAIRNVIDFSRPVAVLLIAVLHFLPDDAGPHGIVRAIASRLAPAAAWPSATSPPTTCTPPPRRPPAPPTTAHPPPASPAPATTSSGSSTACNPSRPASPT